MAVSGAPDTQPFDSDLPGDVAGERTVLGTMLTSGERLTYSAELLTPAMFVVPAHQLLYQAVLDHHHDDMPVTVDALERELRRRGQLDEVGGRAYLCALAEGASMGNRDAVRAAGVVESKALLRRVVLAGEEIAESGRRADRRGDADAGALIENARELLHSVTADRAPLHASLAKRMEALLTSLDDVARVGGFEVNVPTGFGDLDAVTGGWAPGSLTVVGGYPGHGSSTLALGFARTAALACSRPAAVLSLDTPAEVLTERVFSAEARIRHGDLRAGRMSADDWSLLATRMTAVSEAPLVLEMLEDTEISAVTRTVKSLVEEQLVTLVVIDSLHLLTARRSGLPYENREREVAEITRRLKRLALETGIAVIATVQLSTNPGPRLPAPGPPSLADLRDSGTIAHVADNVLLLHRPDAVVRDHPRFGEADLHLVKHSFGPPCVITVAQQMNYCRFTDIAKS